MVKYVRSFAPRKLELTKSLFIEFMLTQTHFYVPKYNELRR